MGDTLRFIIGLGVVFSLVGAYQIIYVLNRHLRDNMQEARGKEIEADMARYGTCCGAPEACSLEAKLADIKRRESK